MIKRLPVENIFLCLSLIFGLIYVFLLPPFQSVDEAAHFYRGYEILSGNFLSKKVDNRVGDYLPLSLEKLTSKYSFLIKNIDKKVSVNYIINSAEIKLNSDETKFIEFSNTALYSPICYLTQIPGMYIAKTLGANPIWIFYMGRISNLIFFTIIGYISLKIIPFYKLPMMLLLLMPMTLSLAGSLTSDVVVIGVNFLWISVLLKLLTDDRLINFLRISILFLLASILALSKSYFLLIPLVLLLPRSKFRSLTHYLICILGTLFISIVILVLWQNIIIGFGFDMNSSANSAEQLKFILSNPFNYCVILLKTFVIKLPRILITMVGVLGWQDTRLDFLTYILYPALIIFAVILERRTDFEFKMWQNIIILGDIILSFFFIFTTLYLMWSRVGSSIIFGLSGKYFIPVMMPLLLLFHNRIHLQEKYQDIAKIVIFSAVILILISSDLSLIHRFYDMTPNLHYKV